MNENGKTKALAMVVILLIVGAIIGFTLSYVSFKKGKEQLEKYRGEKVGGRIVRIFAFRYLTSMIIISINIFLLLGLLWVYMNTYAKTKSSFMLGLIFFIGVLLIQSLLSLPILHALFGYTPYGLGPFGVLPHLFETLALIILLILSLE